MSKCDERFARQYHYEPPPGFPLASPYSDIVHNLSGPNTYAHTQTFLKDQSRPRVDSLIRVSRRVDLYLFIRHRWWNIPNRKKAREARHACVGFNLQAYSQGRCPPAKTVQALKPASRFIRRGTHEVNKNT